MKIKSSERNGKRDDDGTRSCSNAVGSGLPHSTMNDVVNYGRSRTQMVKRHPA